MADDDRPGDSFLVHERGDHGGLGSRVRIAGAACRETVSRPIDEEKVGAALEHVEEGARLIVEIAACAMDEDDRRQIRLRPLGTKRLLIITPLPISVSVPRFGSRASIRDAMIEEAIDSVPSAASPKASNQASDLMARVIGRSGGLAATGGMCTSGADARMTGGQVFWPATSSARSE